MSVLCLLVVVWYVRRPKPPPPAPLPSDLKEAMAELFGTRYAAELPEGDADRARFRRVSQMFALQLPSVPATTGPEPLKWTTLTFSENGEKSGAVRFSENGGQFGAVRFLSSLDKPADLRCCFVVEGKPFRREWGIVAAQRKLPYGFEVFQSDRNVVLGVDGIPDRNAVYLQPLDGGVIQPGAQYILWFAFKHTKEPVDLHMAIRLEPQGTFPRSTTMEQLAQDLGLTTPLKHVSIDSVDELLTHIRKRYLRHDLTTAMQFAEQAGHLMPKDRHVLLWLGYLKILRGRQLADNHGRSEGHTYFFAAAQHLRELRDAYDERTDIEDTWLAEAIYLEAESLALTGEKEKALASLREALHCGFDGSRVEAKYFQPTIGADELNEIVSEFRDN